MKKLTRLILNALSSQNEVVIVSEDTDVMFLMVWAYVKFNVTKDWYMNYEVDKYVCIKDVVDYLGEEISLCLPHIHGMTGCDTTFTFFRMGEINVLKKIQKNPATLSLIENLGAERILDEETIECATEFVRNIIYNGKSKENYIKTLVRLYKSSTSNNDDSS